MLTHLLLILNLFTLSILATSKRVLILDKAAVQINCEKVPSNGH